MTKIAELDLLKLPNSILRKIRGSHSENLGIFNTFNLGIFIQSQNSGPLE